MQLACGIITEATHYRKGDGGFAIATWGQAEDLEEVYHLELDIPNTRVSEDGLSILPRIGLEPIERARGRGRSGVAGKPARGGGRGRGRGADDASGPAPADDGNEDEEGVKKKMRMGTKLTRRLEARQATKQKTTMKTSKKGATPAEIAFKDAKAKARTIAAEE